MSAGLQQSIRLYVGDAVRLHALSDPLQVFDKVISLDSAYHYRTREAFLTQALQKLKPGGRICLADIILWQNPSSLGGRLLLKAACKVTGVPEENLVDFDAYKATFSSLGYRDLQASFIEENVFAGLAVFIERHQVALGPFVRPNLWTRYKVFSWILRAIHENKVLRFVIVTATK